MKNRIGDAQLTIEFLDHYKPLEIERRATREASPLPACVGSGRLAHSSERAALLRCGLRVVLRTCVA